MATPTLGVLLLVAVVGAPTIFTPAAAAATNANANANYDCAAGCPLGDPLFVCGADGMTYGSPCLAVCAGVTTVAHEGPCAPGGAETAAKRREAFGALAAASGGNIDAPARIDPSQHPVASLLAPAGSLSTTKTVSPAQMRRFASEGFVLAGAIKQAESDADFPDPGKEAPPPDDSMRSAGPRRVVVCGRKDSS